MFFMKKRLLSILLVLVMCLGLLSATVFAAESDLPDWYFLFAVFKNLDAEVKDGNGKMQHAAYSMPQEEVGLIHNLAAEFEEYMNSLGVMRAHVEVVEIDKPVKELYSEDTDQGSFLRAEEAAPLLKEKVNLDRYDHVTCFLNLTVWTCYAGITSAPFENGPGISCLNYQTWERHQKDYDDLTNQNFWHIQLPVHEFLHFGEQLNEKWGEKFVLHRDGKTHYVRTDDWKTYYTDALLNQLTDLDVFPEGGTGIAPVVWQYPPHAMRTMKEWTIPSGVTSIGHDAFLNYTNLTSVTIPSSVTFLDVSAFNGCTGLTSVTIPTRVTSIGAWAFQGCAALTKVSIPASVTSIGEVAFYNTGLQDVYYAGTEAQWKAIQVGEYNEALTGATIHYNHLMADVKATDWFAQPVTWALEKGITAGTGGGNFSPSANCTVAQILTFLWRASGSPKPTASNPFSDIKSDDYYADAAVWAHEKGLVSGATFSGNMLCTRAMAVTYMWKLSGSPSAKTAGFTDVLASADYANAVAWAVEKSVTSGTSATTFSPDNICTRGQIVTFLYRELAK